MKSPIGIFDSGVGGTSIWKEINRLLPNEDTIYLADSKNAPYGEKPKEEILHLSIKNTEFLLEKGCKLIVVACNTATTNAIDYLREHYDVPFIGIEPAIKPAALQTKTKKVGVLATKGTLASSLFHNTSKLHASGIKVFEKEGHGLVELIEAGQLHSPETKKLLQDYLNPMVEAGIDCLVLGCTHYPYLIPLLQEMLPTNINIIDSGEAVARQAKTVLVKNDLLNDGNPPFTHQFFTNKDVSILNKFADITRASFLDF
ncbi:glutamate racemase [Allomuricauda sp. d1]|uniref:glutamate racemase n=1 Tax=Allomuricauda sp. d1 TaxID=3136725 RepID=UPI0031D272CA